MRTLVLVLALLALVLGEPRRFPMLNKKVAVPRDAHGQRYVRNPLVALNKAATRAHPHSLRAAAGKYKVKRLLCAHARWSLNAACVSAELSASRQLVVAGSVVRAGRGDVPPRHHHSHTLQGTW